MRPRGGGQRWHALPADPGIAQRRDRREKMRRFPLRLLVLAAALLLLALCTPHAGAIVTPDVPASIPAPSDGSSASASGKVSTAPVSVPASSASQPTTGGGRAAPKREAAGAMADPSAAKPVQIDAGSNAGGAVDAASGAEGGGSGSRAGSAASAQMEADAKVATGSSSPSSSSSGPTTSSSSLVAAAPSSPPGAVVSSASAPKPQRVTEVYVEEVSAVTD